MFTLDSFFCEPMTAAALPGDFPSRQFWKELAERRERHGTPCFDEVVTGIGHTASWSAAFDLPSVPDIVTTAKGLGSGYAALGAVVCHRRILEAIVEGSRRFTLGHTRDGAPVNCAVGLAALDVLRWQALISRVAEKGESLKLMLARALSNVALVGEVRGRGLLIGVAYVDPTDRRSFRCGS